MLWVPVFVSVRPMKIDILTLFPGFFSGPLDSSILRRAIERGLLEVNLIDIRDFTHDKHRTADDEPYGGGPGMVMKPEPIAEALESLKRTEDSVVIYLSPDGERLTHDLVLELSEHEQLVLLCGHYEGIDQRIRDAFVDMEISIGDYVLTGGEVAALVVVDAVSRMIPGVLGDPESARNDSFADGLLDFPHYTRPANFRGMKVPDVLLSGNHAQIARWRRKQQLLRTYRLRPDLLDKMELGMEDRMLLEEALNEQNED